MNTFYIKAKIIRHWNGEYECSQDTARVEGFIVNAPDEMKARRKVEQMISRKKFQFIDFVSSTQCYPLNP